MIPTLAQPDGVDLVAYGDRVLARYANPGLRHTTVQIAMDGSQKLPQRLVAPALAAIGAGRRPHAITLGVAAWMAYVALGQDRDGRPLPLDDPMADVLGQVRGTTDAATVVDRLLAIDPDLRAGTAGDSAGGGASSSTTSATFSPGTSRPWP